MTSTGNRASTARGGRRDLGSSQYTPAQWHQVRSRDLRQRDRVTRRTLRTGRTRGTLVAHCALATDGALCTLGALGTLHTLHALEALCTLRALEALNTLRAGGADGALETGRASDTDGALESLGTNRPLDTSHALRASITHRTSWARGTSGAYERIEGAGAHCGMRGVSDEPGEGQRGDSACCNCTNKLLHETPMGIVNEGKREKGNINCPGILSARSWECQYFDDIAAINVETAFSGWRAHR